MTRIFGNPSSLASLVLAGTIAGLGLGPDGVVEIITPEEEERRRRERAEVRRLAEQERITQREAEERRRKAEYEAKAAPYRAERARRQQEQWAKQHPEAKS